MMPLSDEQKRARQIDQLMDTARCVSPRKYMLKYAAPVFRRMVRAEAAAIEGAVLVVFRGEIFSQWSPLGRCACVTCGKVLDWAADSKAGEEKIDTGHFIPGKRSSVYLLEENTAPQCVSCNKHRNGNLESFVRWMKRVRGQETIDRLEALNAEDRKFTHEELVMLRLGYAARIKAATARLASHCKTQTRA